MSNVTEIIKVWKQVDAAEGRVSALKWKLAELIAAELATGKSKAQLAEEIGKSAQHIMYMERAWNAHKDATERPEFNEAYQAAKTANSGSRGSRSGSKAKPETSSAEAALKARIAELEAKNREQEKRIQALQTNLWSAQQKLKSAGSAARTYGCDDQGQKLLNKAMGTDNENEAVAAFTMAWKRAHTMKGAKVNAA